MKLGDAISRRDLFRLGATAIGGTALAPILRADENPPSATAPTNKFDKFVQDEFTNKVKTLKADKKEAKDLAVAIMDLGNEAFKKIMGVFPNNRKDQEIVFSKLRDAINDANRAPLAQSGSKKIIELGRIYNDLASTKFDRSESSFEAIAKSYFLKPGQLNLFVKVKPGQAVHPGNCPAVKEVLGSRIKNFYQAPVYEVDDPSYFTYGRQLEGPIVIMNRALITKVAKDFSISEQEAYDFVLANEYAHVCLEHALNPYYISNNENLFTKKIEGIQFHNNHQAEELISDACSINTQARDIVRIYSRKKARNPEESYYATCRFAIIKTREFCHQHGIQQPDYDNIHTYKQLKGFFETEGLETKQDGKKLLDEYLAYMQKEYKSMADQICQVLFTRMQDLAMKHLVYEHPCLFKPDPNKIPQDIGVAKDVSKFFDEVVIPELSKNKFLELQDAPQGIAFTLKLETPDLDEFNRTFVNDVNKIFKQIAKKFPNDAARQYYCAEFLKQFSEHIIDEHLKKWGLHKPYTSGIVTNTWLPTHLGGKVSMEDYCKNGHTKVDGLNLLALSKFSGKEIDPHDFPETLKFLEDLKPNLDFLTPVVEIDDLSFPFTASERGDQIVFNRAGMKVKQNIFNIQDPKIVDEGTAANETLHSIMTNTFGRPRATIRDDTERIITKPIDSLNFLNNLQVEQFLSDLSNALVNPANIHKLLVHARHASLEAQGAEHNNSYPSYKFAIDITEQYCASHGISMPPGNIYYLSELRDHFVAQAKEGETVLDGEDLFRDYLLYTRNRFRETGLKITKAMAKNRDMLFYPQRKRQPPVFNLDLPTATA